MRFNVGDMVRVIGKNRVGIVCERKQSDGFNWYRIKIDGFFWREDDLTNET